MFPFEKGPNTSNSEYQIPSHAVKQEVHYVNIEETPSNSLVMAKDRESDRNHTGKLNNLEVGNAQELIDAEREGIMAQHPNLFIHPDDLKDWKKFLAKKKKDKQVQYSETIRNRMMRQSQKSNQRTSPPRNQQLAGDSFVNRGSPRSKKQKQRGDVDDKSNSPRMGALGETMKKAQPQIAIHSYQNEKKFYQGRGVKTEGLPSL